MKVSKITNNKIDSVNFSDLQDLQLLAPETLVPFCDNTALKSIFPALSLCTENYMFEAHNTNCLIIGTSISHQNMQFRLYLLPK